MSRKPTRTPQEQIDDLHATTLAHSLILAKLIQAWCRLAAEKQDTSVLYSAEQAFDNAATELEEICRRQPSPPGYMARAGRVIEEVRATAFPHKGPRKAV